MRSTAGSDSDESDPAVRREALRRRLYMLGGGDDGDLAAFLELEPSDGDTAKTHAVAEVPEDTAAPAVEEEPPPSARRTRSRVLVGAVGAIGVVLLTATVAIAIQSAGPRALPETVPIPASSGSTLLVYSRASNPESAPRAVTFEPANYDVFFPKGARVEVTLRCVGRGDVRISAARRFYFHCTERQTVQRQSTSVGETQPFLVLGRTTGNVVWSLRIVTLPSRDGH